MEENRNMEHEVEKTMQSLEGLERATTDDFFYARLEERMAEREEHYTVFGRLSPALATAAAALCLLILFNILTVLHYSQQYGDSDDLHQENIEAMAEEYYLEVPLIYELENNE